MYTNEDELLDFLEQQLSDTNTKGKATPKVKEHEAPVLTYELKHKMREIVKNYYHAIEWDITRFNIDKLLGLWILEGQKRNANWILRIEQNYKLKATFRYDLDKMAKEMYYDSVSSRQVILMKNFVQIIRDMGREPECKLYDKKTDTFKYGYYGEAQHIISTLNDQQPAAKRDIIIAKNQMMKICKKELEDKMYSKKEIMDIMAQCEKELPNYIMSKLQEEPVEAI